MATKALELESHPARRRHLLSARALAERNGAFPLRIIEEELQRIPSKGWAEMIRKVYEAHPLLCSQCGGTMKVIAFLTNYAVVDKIINRLKLTFVAERPPPPHIAYQEVLMAAEAPAEYSS